MAIREHLQQLSQALLDSDYSVAAQPDHPMLLSGPDLIAGRNGSLLVFFALHKEDLHSGDTLLLRLALTKLALPRHARSILVLDNAPQSLSSLVTQNFHQIHLAENPHTWLRHVAEPARDSHIDPVPIHIQDDAFQRFEVIYASTIEQTTGESTPSTSPEAIVDQLMQEHQFEFAIPQPWTLPRTAHGALNMTKRLRIGTDGISLDFIPSKPSPYTRKRIRDLALLMTRMCYRLDNGVPYRQQIPAGLLLTEQTPELLHDPLKYRRAAAFAGWSIFRPHSAAQAFEQAQFLQRQLNEISR